jgi:hypothetical protein
MQKDKHKVELKNVKQAKKKSNPKVEIEKDIERRKEKKQIMIIVQIDRNNKRKRA